MRTKLAAGAFLLVLAVAAAGCGGGGKKNGTTAVAATSAATSTETTTESSGDTSTSGAAGKPKSCAELEALASKVSTSFQNTNPENIEDNAKKLKEFADQTPDEIRPDFELLAEDVEKVAGAMKGLKNGQQPTAEEAQKIQKAVGSINQKKLQLALQHITTWSTKNC
jgi:hypothetical protein